jgi:tetratricopeptide (TPR) repeat protein
VIATHLLDAVQAQPDDADADDTQAEARGWLTRAAERAAALAATDDAQRTFAAAAELTGDPLERARLLERAGEVARMANRLDDAERLLRTAFALCADAGATHDRARVAAALGTAVWQLGRIEEAIELMEGALAVLASDDPDEDVATLAAQLGRLHFFAENADRAAEHIETALDIAERLVLPSVVASALNTKSLIRHNRPYEGDALLRQALKIALDHDLVFEALRAYNNLLIKLDAFDRPEELEPMMNEALALARRRGDRFWEVRFVASLAEEYRFLGRWDEAVTLAESLPRETKGDPLLMSVVLGSCRIAIDRDQIGRAHELMSGLEPEGDTSDFQVRFANTWREHVAAELDGGPDLGTAAVRAVEATTRADLPAQTVADTLNDAATYVARHGDRAIALEALALLDGSATAGTRTRVVATQRHRLGALVAAIDGDEDAAAEAFGLALANARSVSYPYFLAPVLGDYGAWLIQCGRGDEAAPLLAEARELYEAMGATARIQALDEVAPEAVVG